MVIDVKWQLSLGQSNITFPTQSETCEASECAADVIVCSYQTECTVSCQQASSCNGATVNGVYTKSLTVLGSSDGLSSGIVYAPNNNNNDVNTIKYPSSFYLYCADGQYTCYGARFIIEYTNNVSIYSSGIYGAFEVTTIDASNIDTFTMTCYDCDSAYSNWKFKNVCYFKLELNTNLYCIGTYFEFDNVGMVYAGTYFWDCICGISH